MRLFAPDQSETRSFGFWTDGKGNVFTDAGLTKSAFLPELGTAGLRIALGPPQTDFPWQIQNIFSSWTSPPLATTEGEASTTIKEQFEIIKRNVSPIQKTTLTKEQIIKGESGGLSQLQFYPTILRERQQLTYTIGITSTDHVWETNKGLILEGQFSINYSIQQL